MCWLALTTSHSESSRPLNWSSLPNNQSYCYAWWGSTGATCKCRMNIERTCLGCNEQVVWLRKVRIASTWTLINLAMAVGWNAEHGVIVMIISKILSAYWKPSEGHLLLHGPCIKSDAGFRPEPSPLLHADSGIAVSLRHSLVVWILGYCTSYKHLNYFLAGYNNYELDWTSKNMINHRGHHKPESKDLSVFGRVQKTLTAWPRILNVHVAHLHV